jgi:L-methionine (R)-S-oxide reductase
MDKKIKGKRYERIIDQLSGLMGKTSDPVARMATLAALLYHKMDSFFWCGFYRLVNDELTVGPYQGALACQVLQKNRGVCWAAINSRRTVIVADVEQFPGHIACDSRARSEIVVPLFDAGRKVWAVLDVDSDRLNSFDDDDGAFLERIVALVGS